jgi:hypothetical protein
MPSLRHPGKRNMKRKAAMKIFPKFGMKNIVERQLMGKDKKSNLKFNVELQLLLP